mgnify:CR=1 FL=1
MLAAIASQFWLIVNRLTSGGGVGEGLTGPVGIALLTNEVTKLGTSYILEFGALISLNLAIINILPIPALDGGRIMFLVIEWIIHKPLPTKIVQSLIIGSFAVLVPLGLVPEGLDVAVVQAHIFGDTWGPIGFSLFLAMAFLMLFSVMWTVIDALTRMLSDILYTNSRTGPYTKYLAKLNRFDLVKKFYSKILIPDSITNSK